MNAITATFTGTFGGQTTTYNLPEPTSVYAIATTYSGLTPDSVENFGRVSLYLNNQIVYSQSIASGSNTYYPGGFIADKITITVGRNGVSGTTEATADITQNYVKLFSLSTDYGILANGAAALNNLYIENDIIVDNIKTTFGDPLRIDSGSTFEIYTGGNTTTEALRLDGLGNLQIKRDLTLNYDSTTTDSFINFSNATQANIQYDDSEDEIIFNNVERVKVNSDILTTYRDLAVTYTYNTADRIFINTSSLPTTGITNGANSTTS